jgi:hypothetical protein
MPIPPCLLNGGVAGPTNVSCLTNVASPAHPLLVDFFSGIVVIALILVCVAARLYEVKKERLKQASKQSK